MLQFHTYLNEEGKNTYKYIKILYFSHFFLPLSTAFVLLGLYGCLMWLTYFLWSFYTYIYIFLFLVFRDCMWSLSQCMYGSRVYKYYIIHLCISVYIEFNFGFVLWESFHTIKRCMITSYTTLLRMVFFSLSFGTKTRVWNR